MGTTTIYHNPQCSKSRATLQLLRDKGIEPRIIEYLREPPDAATLKHVLTRLGMRPADLIRGREYAELNLAPTDSDDELIRRMAAHPQIIERPIVVRGDRACVGRPPENVLKLL